MLKWLRKIFKSKRRRFQENNLEKFMSRIKVVGDCWEWQGYLTTGYGKYQSKEYDKEYAHRASWRLFVGSPRGGIICHKCNNKRCVNPDHLYFGTHKTNKRDQLERIKNQDQTCHQR